MIKRNMPFKINRLWPATWSPPILIIILCLLTLVIRILYSAFVPISSVHNEWDSIAANVAQGYGYVSSWPKTYISPNLLNIPNYKFPLVPTASRVPVPVLYFAFMYKMFGLNDHSLLIGQWLLDVLTCAVLFLITQRIFKDRRISVITCFAWAFYFPALCMSNSRYSEPITTFLLASLVAVWLADSHPQQLWRYGLAGILWSLIILSRPIMITLPVILIPILIMAARQRTRSILLACVVFAVWCPCDIPMDIQNLQGISRIYTY